jgi:O-antigen/teichoic acid export membrane protein
MVKNLTKSTITGASWVLTGNMLTLILRIAFLAILARLLSPNDFGLAAVGTSFSTFANLFTDAGMSNTLVQRDTLRAEHVSTAFTYSITLGLAFCAATVALAAPMERFFAMSGLGEVLSVMGISFMLQGLCVVPRALLKREMRYRTLAIVDLVAFNVGYGMTGCILAVLHCGVWSLVLAVTANNALSAALYYSYAPEKISLSFDRTAFRELSRIGSAFTIAAAANLVALQGDNLIVGQTLGAKALGYYGRAYQLMTIPANALGQVTSYVVFPALSKIQNDPERMRRAFLRATKMTAFVGLPASVLLPMYSHEIVHILFGPKWLAITPILSILGLGTYFRLGYKVPGTVLQALGEVRTDAAVQCVYAACVVSGALIAVRSGLEVVSAVILGSVAVTFLLANIFALRMLRMPIRTFLSATCLPGALASVLAAANYALIRFTQPYGPDWLTVSGGVLVSGIVLLLALSIPACRRSLVTS